MPRRKFSVSELWEIKTLIKRGTSFKDIRKEFKTRGLTISKGYLSKLKHLPPDVIPTGKNRERRTDAIRKLKAPDLESLRKSISVVNPPTQAHLAKRFGCTSKTIRNAIQRVGMRLVKKPKCHALSEKTIEKRWKRSRPLYRRLCNERWRKYVTSDEAWVYLSNTGGQRSVQYISRDAKRSAAEPAVHVEHPRGVMVWVAISVDGVSRPLFIRPGAKIDAKYYQKNVLQPFFNRDPLWKPSKIFHQDSAPSHKAKTTLRYLDKKNQVHQAARMDAVVTRLRSVRLLLVGLSQVPAKQAKAPVGSRTAKGDRSGAAEDPAGDDEQCAARLAEAFVASVSRPRWPY